MPAGSLAECGTELDRDSLIARVSGMLEALAEPHPADAADRLADYLRLLHKWNQTWNLTAVRELAEMVPRHLADSLSIRPWLGGRAIADVGSGAGLPGLPLAIVEPGKHFTLIDSAAKRTRFMQQAVAALGLGNVVVARCRVQDYHPASGFDTVISRAFASLAEFVAAAGHLCRTDGRLLAMKGRYPNDEIAQIPTGWRLTGADPVAVPGLKAERHVVMLGQAPGAAGQE